MLVEKEYILIYCDPCIFISLTIPMMLVVYVDDITATGSQNHISKVFSFVHIYFELTIKDTVTAQLSPVSLCIRS
jgi:hypothetical protein